MMDVSSFKQEHSKFRCFPDQSGLKSCSLLSLPSHWGLLCPLGFFPGVDSAFSQLLAPRACVLWNSLTAGIHGHGVFVTALGGFCMAALRPYCFYFYLKISLHLYWNENGTKPLDVSGIHLG